MKKIAVIGAGPAGIEAASLLATQGLEVVIYEKEGQPLHNLTDKAYLFPNFADAQEVSKEILAKLSTPRLTLKADTEVTQLQPQAATNGWLVNGEAYNAVLLATGYSTFDAHRKEELGYGIYPGIHTSLEMEKMLREGKIVNTIGDTPRRIAFLQCVGSRDEKVGNHYCSKLCCVTAVKQAIEVKKLMPQCEVYVFYMDLRMWGQHFEELYRQAQSDYGIKFIRGRISEAGGTFDRKVQIKAEDTLMGRPLKLTVDLFVLMVGMEASRGTRNLGMQTAIGGDYGFVQSVDPHIADNLTAQSGLFVAGSCKRPMTLTDSLTDARSAAYEVLKHLLAN
jgi:heterodisulfide reductase subunit A